MNLPLEWQEFDSNLTHLAQQAFGQLKDETYFPNSELVFNAFQLCKPQEIKVVILGQDPYHQAKQANGLAFSVSAGIKCPPSLNNIFTALENDMGDEVLIKSSDLSTWAEQGVFLLNRALTVLPNTPNSHAHIWKAFTENVIKGIARNYEGIVYLLWGKSAQEIEKYINPSNNLILKTVHPSPLSAYRGFFKCKHFSKTNDYLVEQGKQPVDWNLA